MTALTERERRALFGATLRDALRQQIAADKDGRDGRPALDKSLATAGKLASSANLAFFSAR